MKQYTLYLTGPIHSDRKLRGADIQAFSDAKAQLTACGYAVVNCCEGIKPVTKAGCDGVAVLPGSAKSKACMRDIKEANDARMTVDSIQVWIDTAPSFTLARRLLMQIERVESLIDRSVNEDELLAVLRATFDFVLPLTRGLAGA